MHLFAIVTLLFGGLAVSMPPDFNNGLAKRQMCFPSGDCTKLEGNGDPHQKYLHKQLSGPVDCKALDCSVGYEQQISYQIEASIAGSAGWIDSGFAVSKSWATGVTNECSGHPGDTICVWQKVAHTAYTVRPGIANQCASDGCEEYDDTVVITSPNANNAGGKFYCMVKHTCGTQGDEWWEDGAPGGPP